MKFKYIRNAKLFSLFLAITVMIASCDQCNPYANKPAVINKFNTENSNTTQGKGENIVYNVQNADALRVEADYNKDGTISDSEKDEISNYEGGDATFTTRTLDKLGDLEFKLIATGKDGAEVIAKTNTNVIAHALPDLSGSNFSGIEGRTITFELPTVDGVEYTTINVSNDGSKIISSSLDNTTKKFTLQTSEDITEQGSYDIEFGYKIPETGITGTISKIGNAIKNLWEAYLTLESNESHGVGEAGRIKAYDVDTGQELTVVDTLGGNAHLKLSNPDVTRVMLQGKFTRDSYYRKKVFDATKDIPASENLKYRVVPAPDFYLGPGNTNWCTKEQFREFMETINMPTYIRPEDGKEVGLTKWNLENLKGIEILRTNPNSTKGAYTITQQDYIETILLDSDGLTKIIRGKSLAGLVQKDNESSIRHYTFGETGNITSIEPGYILIVPDNTIIGGATNVGYLINSELTGIVDKAKVRTG